MPGTFTFTRDFPLDRAGMTQWYPIVAAIVGDQRVIEGGSVEVVVALPLLRRETILHPDLMIQVPEVVVLQTGIHPQLRCAGRGLVVEFHPSMHRELILDLERERAGAGFGAGTDDGIDLAVAAGVGDIQFTLENV